MKVLLLAGLLALSAPSVASAACQGFYSFIPADLENETPFSVEIRGGFVKVLFTDYSTIRAWTTKTDKGVVFNDDEGVVSQPGEYKLNCRAKDATFFMPPEEPGGRYVIYRLQPTQGDIWSVARQRGWRLGH